jgi:hypothetical protein
MAASKLTAQPVLTLTRPCAVAVVEHAALYYSTSADDTVQLAAGSGSTLRFAGFARYAQTVAGKPVEFTAAGQDIAIASAAIAVGDPLESYSTAGKVRTKASGGGNVIGYALTAASADGDLVKVDIVKTL